MQLFEIYEPSEDTTIVETYVDETDGEIYHLILNEKLKEFSFQTTKKSAINDFKSFLKKHPFLTGVAASVGLTAIDAYRQNKRLTTRFFAKTPIERKFFAKVSQDLVSTGKYIMVRKKMIHGGLLYELKRKSL